MLKYFLYFLLAFYFCASIWEIEVNTQPFPPDDEDYPDLGIFMSFNSNDYLIFIFQRKRHMPRPRP